MTRPREFARVRAEGQRLKAGVLDVRYTPADGTSSRVGLVVPRYRHSAVDRNRLKRRLRELVRLELLPALAGRAAPVDVVIRVIPPAYERDMDALRRHVRTLVRQLGEPARSEP